MAYGIKTKIITIICITVLPIIFVVFFVIHFLGPSNIQIEVDKFASSDIKKHVEAVDNLLQDGRDGIEALRNHFIDNPAEFEIMLKHWNNLNMTLEDGLTPLAHAVIKDDLYLVKLYIAKGAKINYPMWFEETRYVKIAGKFNRDIHDIKPVYIFNLTKSEAMRKLLENNNVLKIDVQGWKDKIELYEEPFSMHIKLDKSQPVGNSKLAEFEQSGGVTLPVEYKAFLLKHNGATPGKNIFKIPGGNESSVRQFIPLDKITNEKKHIDNVSCRFIPVAYDDCGNYVCLNLDNNGSVFFWDHEAPSGNLYLAANFNGFLRMLKPFNAGDVELDPSRIKKAWIDPAFKKKLRKNEEKKKRR